MSESKAEANFRHNMDVVMKDKGITITKLCEDLGIKPPSLYPFLRGENGITIERAEKIAKCLGMPIVAMLSEKFEAVATR